LYDDFSARWEPVGELGGSEHLILDTIRPVEGNVELLRSRLVEWSS
jgi:hypothetical protein